MATYTNAKEIKEFRRLRRKDWVRDQQHYFKDTFNWLKRIVYEAKLLKDDYGDFAEANSHTCICGETRNFTKNEFKNLGAINYPDEIFWYFAQVYAKADFDDYTREQIGSTLRRTKSVWRRFLTGKALVPLQSVLKKPLEKVPPTEFKAVKAFPPVKPGVYVCTVCGRAMASPIEGDRTCRGTNFHKWIFKP